MTNKMKKGLILTPVICENAEQHNTESAALLKEVRKPNLGKHYKIWYCPPCSSFPMKKTRNK